MLPYTRSSWKTLGLSLFTGMAIWLCSLSAFVVLG
jgi:hypothetical protein